MDKAELRKFQKTLREHYRTHGRHELPWRSAEPDGSFDPYKILVSEIMLQQTQVPRVIPKYQEFLAAFPDTKTLAEASLGDVLKVWNGLGYNRRAKFLWQAAQKLHANWDGELPDNVEDLVGLPGIGKNTAGAVLAYAFNKPAVFVETNIRTVFIYHFFHDRDDIADAEIVPLLQETLESQSPRIHYWSLMDYGTFLKQSIGNLNKLSREYAKQSTFEGSRRQIRGQIIRLLSGKPMKPAAISAVVADERLDAVLADLLQEGLIRKNSTGYELA